MSISRNGINGGHFYSNLVQPLEVDLNFVVDVANGNGLGERSLKSNGFVEHVFMHSTASFIGTTHTGTASVTGIPSGTSSLKVGMPVQTADLPAGTTIASIVDSGSITLSQNATTGHIGATITYQAVGSPNPEAGYVLIQMKSNMSRFIGASLGFASYTSGSPILVASAGVTAGLAYVIVSLGTTSVANWHVLGVPAGVTPAVGVSFIAPLTATVAGSGAVEVPASSGIVTAEVIGDPNLSTSLPIASNSGQWILMSLLSDADALAAPLDGTVCGIRLLFDQSSVTVDGQ